MQGNRPLSAGHRFTDCFSPNGTGRGVAVDGATVRKVVSAAMSYMSPRRPGDGDPELRRLAEEQRERRAEEWVQTHPDGPPPKRHPIRTLWDSLSGRRHDRDDSR